MVSLQNLLSLEERLRAENTEAARLNPEKMSIDNEVPFVRQGSGRRPGPRKRKHNPQLNRAISVVQSAFVSRQKLISEIRRRLLCLSIWSTLTFAVEKPTELL